ncbi:MAG: hypothetical protein RJB02_1540 [Pseudomonadota bacterium]
MKLLAVLLLTLGLAFQAGPSCATAGQTTMVSIAIDCSAMDDPSRSTPESDGKDRVAACHACVSRLAEAPTVSRGFGCKNFVPVVELQNAIPGNASKPPTPPPRDQYL